MSDQQLIVKPNDASERISLKVVNQELEDVFFSVRRDTFLQRVINAYHQKVAEDTDNANYVFLYDGREIKGHQTPNELEMENGAEIDAMLHVDGGSGDIFST